MQILRPYQQEVVDSVSDRCMVVMPTGTGKSAVIAALVRQFKEQGKSVVVVVPTIELKNQMALQMGCEVVVWKSARGLRHQVWLHDECHHSAASSWEKLIEENPGAVHIGFTATPLRLDGKPLKGFTRLIEPHPIGWYMDNGYLCKNLREYTVDLGVSQWKPSELEDLEAQFDKLDNHTIYGSIVDNYLRLVPGGAKSIAFGATIAHCYKIAEAFQGAGVKSQVIHSGQKAGERRQLMEQFRCGEITQLVNVNILSEGIDVPDATAVVMLRATNSLAMYYQWVGRVLRPGKPKAVVLDFVGNLLRHGSVADNQGWAAEYEEAIRMELLSTSYVCRCGQCGEVLSYPGQTCPVCGYRRQVLAKGSDLPREKQGLLKEMALSPFAVQVMRAQGKVDPVQGYNLLLRHKKLFCKGDSVLLMQYLGRWFDRRLADELYGNIAENS